MSDPVAPIEDDRIARWREERLRIAEQEKEKRIAAKEKEKITDALSAEDTADILLSQFDDFEAFVERTRIDHQKIRKRNRIRFLISAILPAVICIILLRFFIDPLHLVHAEYTLEVPQAQTRNTGENLIPQLDKEPDQTAHITTRFINSGTFDRSYLAAALNSHPAPAVLTEKTSARFLRPYYDGAVHSYVEERTGLVTLKLWAKSREAALRHARAALKATSDHLNWVLSQQAESRIKKTTASVARAEARLRDSSDELSRLQIRTGVLNPSSILASRFEQIEILEAEKQKRESELRQLEIAQGLPTRQSERLRDVISDFETRLSEMRANMNTSTNGDNLGDAILKRNQLEIELELAQGDLALARAAQSSALRDAAASQNLLQIVVPPYVKSGQKFPRILPSALVVFIIGSALFAVWQILSPVRPNQ